MKTKAETRQTFTSILETLSKVGIATFTVSKDKKNLFIREEYNQVFWAELNKAEALKLVDELKALAERMT